MEHSKLEKIKGKEKSRILTWPRGNQEEENHYRSFNEFILAEFIILYIDHEKLLHNATCYYK